MKSAIIHTQKEKAQIEFLEKFVIHKNSQHIPNEFFIPILVELFLDSKIEEAFREGYNAGLQYALDVKEEVKNTFETIITSQKE